MTDAIERSLNDILIGESAGIASVRELIRRFAPSPVPVLIQGPTGSGKELVAHALHTLSGRTGAFVAFNVCALADGMFEDQLFGHVRGAFTGAVSETPGYLLEAHRGSLFLDEIGSLPLAVQPKLLRAIESKRFRQHGSRTDRSSDFRVISATNDNLRELVVEGRFREDLFFRLCSGVIQLPSLAQRPADIALLARHFAARAIGKDGTRVVLSDDAVDLLLDYDWPGNVRELKQFIECAAALTDGNTITGSVLLRSAALLRSAPRPHSNPRLDAAARHLLRVLDQTRWNAKATAEILAINKTTVYRRLERLGVPLRRPGASDDPDMNEHGRRPPDTDPSA